jgi:hypothetical protein
VTTDGYEPYRDSAEGEGAIYRPFGYAVNYGTETQILA